MDYVIDNILKNYADRMNRILLFKVLFDLERKQEGKKGEPGQASIRYFDYGFLSLLFFYENMLLRNKKTGVEELAGFFQQVERAGGKQKDFETYRKIAMDIIREFRPASGSRKQYPYYDWEKKTEGKTDFNILKALTLKEETNKRQYYTLDEKGLELVFATGEYYSEFQISIGQMVLRKQLEKGQFQGALKQIQEMKLSVSLLKERIEGIRQEVARNIVSLEVHQRYREMVEDINLRLKYEDEEFRELEEFSRVAYRRVVTEKQSKKNERLQAEILEILTRLAEVHHEHSTLLELGIELKNTALTAARETLYYNGLTSFNFKKEIVSGFVATPLALTATKGVMQPFLPIRREVHWSMLRALDPQTIRRKQQVSPGEVFTEVDPNSTTMHRDMELSIEMQAIADLLLERLSKTGKVLLSDLIEEVAIDQITPQLSYFFILLHSLSPISLQSGQRDHSIFGKAFTVLGQSYQSIEIVETKDQIETGSFKMSDMEIVAYEL